MSIKLLSVILLGKARGPEMDQSSLVRHLGEIVWFPMAWLSNAIEWQAIDASSVRATIHEHGVSASALLSIKELKQRVCGYFGCEQVELLTQKIS